MVDICAACDEVVGDPSARWCGRCGARLTAAPSRPRATRAVGVVDRDPALVGAGTTTLLVDEPSGTEEVAPVAPAWSLRARVAAVAGVALVLVTALVARPQPVVEYEPRGFTARGDATRSGVVSLAPLEAPTGVAWSADVGASRTSASVRAAGDVVLEQSAGGILAVRDATTGTVRWLRRDLAGAGPVVRVADTVVVTSESGTLRGFALADGAERWRLEAVWATAVVPLGDAVVARTEGRLLAVGADSGQVRWQVDQAGELGGTVQQLVPGEAGLGVWLTSPPGLPVVSPRVTSSVAVLDPASGELRFARPLEGRFLRSPLAVGDRYVAWTDDTGTVVATPDGRPIEGRPDHGLAAVVGRAAVATGDLLAVAGRSGGLTGIDLRTGSVRWSRPFVTTDVLAAADGLVVAEDGTVLDARGGETLSIQSRLALDSIGGEPALPYLPTVTGTDLDVRDRAGETVTRVPLVPDEVEPPAVGAGRVFVPTRDGIDAFAVADGTRDWGYGQLEVPAEAGGRTGVRTPAVGATTVLVSPGPGGGPGLVALELGGGVRTWDRADDTPAVQGPLTLAGDVAFVPVGADIHAYDTVTGRRAFAAIAGTARGPLVVGPNRVIGGPAASVRGEHGDEAVAILRRDRSENWRTRLDPAPCSGPVLAGDRVAWGTRDGITALDERTGEPAWRLDTSGPVCLDPVVSGGRMIVVAEPATLVAVPAGTGGVPVWTTELASPPVASPVVAGEHLLVPLLDGTLAAYAVADGSTAWTVDLGGVADASPAVLDGHVLVRLRNGRLLALTP